MQFAGGFFLSGTIWLLTSVSDPHWFQYGSEAIILGQYGSGSKSRALMTKNFLNKINN
jgi:hypothetical protein